MEMADLFRAERVAPVVARIDSALGADFGYKTKLGAYLYSGGRHQNVTKVQPLYNKNVTQKILYQKLYYVGISCAAKSDKDTLDLQPFWRGFS